MVKKEPPQDILAQDYSSYASEYEKYWAPVIWPMALPIFDKLTFSNVSNIIDIGTGTGSMLPYIRDKAPQVSIWGIDYSQGMLEIARQKGEKNLLHMDAQNLTFPSESFDLAVSCFMLFHLPDPLACLKEVRRILVPGGKIGIVTWVSGYELPCTDVWKETLDASGVPPDQRDSAVMQHHIVGSKEIMTELILQSRFNYCEQWSKQFEWTWDAQKLYTLQSNYGQHRRRLDKLDAAQRENCRRKVLSKFMNLNGHSLIWRPEVLYTVAFR